MSAGLRWSGVGGVGGRVSVFGCRGRVSVVGCRWSWCLRALSAGLLPGFPHQGSDDSLLVPTGTCFRGRFSRWAVPPFDFGIDKPGFPRTFPFGRSCCQCVRCLRHWSALGAVRGGGGAGGTMGYFFCMAGFLGGFTTFSFFSLETMHLLQDGRWMAGWVYSALTLVLCLGGVALGQWLGWRVAGVDGTKPKWRRPGTAFLSGCFRKRGRK